MEARSFSDRFLGQAQLRTSLGDSLSELLQQRRACRLCSGHSDSQQEL